MSTLLVSLQHLQKKLQSAYIFQPDWRQVLRVHREENLLGVSVFEPTNSTIIHIIITDNAEQKTPAHLYTPNACKKDEKQPVRMAYLLHKQKATNEFGADFPTFGKSTRRNVLLRSHSMKASKFPRSITNVILVLIQIQSKRDKKSKTE